MESESVHARSDRTNSVLVALAASRRRIALAVLVDEPGPVSIRALAKRVADGRDAASTDVTDDRREHVALVHRELPKLDATGLVEWDRDADTVAAADHPALDSPQIRRVLAAPEAEWDDVLECLAHDRRRTALSIVVDHGGAIGRRNLARRTLARERDAPTSSLSTNDVDEVLASLYHVHLPKLRDAGLVVDDGLETVRYADHPDVDEESLTLDASQGAAPMALVSN
ncbi:hypothetical protein OB920_14285 [Halobacteria archaeon HArc-gm2]|nr:hypothetical protein [Halobacteria archaeon HArc-gm2]